MTLKINMIKMTQLIFILSSVLCGTVGAPAALLNQVLTNTFRKFFTLLNMMSKLEYFISVFVLTFIFIFVHTFLWGSRRQRLLEKKSCHRLQIACLPGAIIYFKLVDHAGFLKEDDGI